MPCAHGRLLLKRWTTHLCKEKRSENSWPTARSSSSMALMHRHARPKWEAGRRNSVHKQVWCSNQAWYDLLPQSFSVCDHLLDVQQVCINLVQILLVQLLFAHMQQRPFSSLCCNILSSPLHLLQHKPFHLQGMPAADESEGYGRREHWCSLSQPQS